MKPIALTFQFPLKPISKEVFRGKHETTAEGTRHPPAEGSSHIAAEANLAVVTPAANPLAAVAPARITNQEVATVLSPIVETVTSLKPIQCKASQH